MAGEFDQKFAANRTWKVDSGLWAAIEHALKEIRKVQLPTFVFDVGAGGGAYVGKLRGLRDVVAYGVDGSLGVEERTESAVFEQRLDVDLGSNWLGKLLARKRGKNEPSMTFVADLAMCIEVGEHIDRSYELNFLNNLCSLPATYLLVSWAVPGQRGRNHVNCRLPEFVACEIGRRGYKLRGDITAELRQIAGRGWDKKLLFFQQTYE